tara:strand:+ start:729 stop:2564 length:1836 start_codon:yes stop_codon:yes gene_type:complete
MKGKNFFLINSDKDLLQARRFILNKKIKNYFFVITSQEAIYSCLKFDVDFISIEKYTKNNEIIKLGNKNFKDINSINFFFDKILKKNIDKCNDYHIEPFKLNQFHFKMVIDTIKLKILYLKNFLNFANKKNDRIFYFSNSNLDFWDKNFYINEKINLYSILAEKIKNKNLKNLSKELNKLNYDFSSSIKKNKTNLTNIKSHIRNIQNLLSKKKKSFIVFDYGHDISYLSKLLKKEKFNLLYLNHILEKNYSSNFEYNKIYKKILSHKKMSNFFKYKGVNFYYLLDDFIKNLIIYLLPKAIQIYEKTIEICSNHKVVFILTGSINLGLLKRASIQALQSKKIPIITYTEGGGYGQFISPIHHNEFCEGDILFSYGKGNLEYIKKLRLKKIKQIIPIGSQKQFLTFKKVKNSSFPKKIKKIMFVGSYFKNNTFAIPLNGSGPCSSLLFQTRILDLLNEFQEKAEIYIKPHQSYNLFEKILKLDRYKKFKNIINGSLNENLKDIDLFIIDFPSTVLLDTLNTNAFIFLLGDKGSYKLTKQQFIKLKKRVYIFQNIQNMRKMLESNLNNRKTISIKKNNSFRDNYSFSLKDKEPILNGLNVINQLMVKNNNLDNI